MPGGGNVDISQFLKGLDLTDKRIARALAEGIDAFAEHVIGDAQEMCPVDTGALMASGTTGEPAKVSEAGVVAKEIGFNTDYAAAVHENLTAHFNTARNPKARAKFLETAMRNNAPKLLPFLTKYVGPALRNGSDK